MSPESLSYLFTFVAGAVCGIFVFAAGVWFYKDNIK